MKTNISFEMKQLTLASLVVTLFIGFFYFMLFYPAGMMPSLTAITYSLLLWFSFIGANLYREYLKLKKKVIEEIEAEKKLQTEVEAAEIAAKKNHLNLLKPVGKIKRSDVIFVAELASKDKLFELDPSFRFDRILEFPIYKFFGISEAKKQVIYNIETEWVFKMYSCFYNACTNDKILEIVVKNIIEISDLLVTFKEEKYKGSEGLLKSFQHYLGQEVKDILKKDLIDARNLSRIKIADL
jgi:hypothetical protein